MPELDNQNDDQLIQEFRNVVLAHRTSLDTRLDDLQRSMRQLGERVTRPPGAAPGNGREALSLALSPGAHLIGNADFQNWLKTEKKHRFVATVPFGRAERKAAILDVGLTTPIGGIVGPQMPQLRVADLLFRVPVDGGAAASFVEETSFTPNATVQNPQGNLKTETSLTFAALLAPFLTTATWTKVSTQSLQDTPSLMFWLNQRLSYAVELKQEQDLLNTAGTGLLAKAAALDPAFEPPAPVQQLDLIGSAISQLEGAGYSPNGVILNAVDANQMRLLKDTVGNYIWSSPSQSVGVTQTWSIPAITSPSMPVGTFLVGAFLQSCLLFERQALIVEISYENEDDFIRHLATLRGELRSALAVAVPQGLVKGTFPAAPPLAAK